MLPRLSFNNVSWTLLYYLFIFQVRGEDSQKAVPSTRTSCPMGSKAYRSYCYTLVTTLKSWFQADLACQKRPSGHLVSILSGGEASFVSSLVTGRVNNNQDIWIWLHDPTMGQQPNGGGWEWSNSDVLNYLNWDGDPSSTVNRGNCGSLTATSEFLKWGDHHCDVELPFVCKFKQ
uniref:Regenerating islet-derived protein 3-alpha n=1 Tax=Rattus norvegicus TaxID=10116 RepID=REG3A_RAT|nr:RecName: Full=Regenerating islet-derived protein 3-alpha; Short=REG-3-alpha; AltName: Full=Islet of Langerhans regenerating protein 3; Short=REG 3; AltName: Full=Lithostathine 3; AltName: Full=Pancreatitis-associated protein 2; AltName: Full=RegIII; AltName: Full=Regenerating islet-derived protein III-alpha; Short=Reg III-alpha; Contains: RecName: Full=Regenerating islet-derived protein 3-alpha 16.5 kDa form; Contains: RecName: Full=Regenerating islet-derived protein 3-alpha 15 kDa form; Flags: 